MKAEAIFIGVEVDTVQAEDAAVVAKLTEVCPVDIFAARDGGVDVVEENLDECILCELCVKAAPPGRLRVVKLYDGTALEA